MQKLIGGVHREHRHGGIRRQPGNLARCLKPVHDGHLKIQCHDVGIQFLDSFNRQFSVLCLTANFPVGVVRCVKASKHYAALSGVTSATAAVLRFSVSNGTCSIGGRGLERKIEFNILTMPEGGPWCRSACLFNQLRTSPMRSQIPNANRADVRRKSNRARERRSRNSAG